MFSLGYKTIKSLNISKCFKSSTNNVRINEEFQKAINQYFKFPHFIMFVLCFIVLDSWIVLVVMA